MLKYDKINYLGLAETIRIENGAAELLVPVKLGIRVLSYRLTGGENVMKIFDAQIKDYAKNEWQSYGGHRLWHAPEDMPRTYDVDNAPLEIAEVRRDGLYLLQRLDPVSLIRKEALITLSEKTTEARIKHTVTNMNRWPVKLAAWALTVLREGGFCAVETPRNEFTLLPDRTLTLWPYARMNDPRAYFGDRVITVKQDTAAKGPFKVGLCAQNGTAVYILPDVVFKKRFGVSQITNDKGQMTNNVLASQFSILNSQLNEYPDYGCNFETYTNSEMLECESLSPLKELKYGESIDWTEVWTLTKNTAGIKQDDEEAIIKILG